MPKGELIDTIRTRSNVWTIYKVYTAFSYELNVFKNGHYEFMSKDLRYIVDVINRRG